MDSYCYRREREISNPSFSSTLLDAIYRSIDEAGDDDDEELVLYRETMRKKHSNMNGSSLRRDHQEHILNFQRACMIEKWMEKKKVSEAKVVLRRNSTAHFDTKSPNDRPHPMMLFNSTSSSSSSSDSSSGSGRGGGFSSSETESVYYGTAVSTRSSSSCYGLQKKPKPIRTSVWVDQPRQDILINNKYHHHDRRHAPQPKPKQKDEGGFSKTRSRALKKIYGDLKKVKQPISPGGRLASFLNSLFTAGGNTRKAKISSANDDDDIMSSYSERKLFKSANASISSTTCSSASSFSRSCLSKTPSSSRGKSGGTTTTTTTTTKTKRSVRFYPVSVIVDEDCQPCGQISLYDHEKKQSLKRSTTTSIISSIHEDEEEVNKFHIMEKNRRLEEAARDLLLRNYQKKTKVETDRTIDMTDSHIKNDHDHQVFRHVDAVDEELEEDDEDAASYASSDLFELDNLSAIGMERYREELPVYETTHLDTNRAIANGFIL